MFYFKEEKVRFSEALDIPKLVVKDVKYWDSLPIKNVNEFYATYSELEDENDHTGCAYICAKYKKKQKEMQMLIYLHAMHMVFNALPYELSQLRFALSNPLYKDIMKNYKD